MSITIDDLLARTHAVVRLKYAGLTLWQKRHEDREEIQELAVMAMDRGATPLPRHAELFAAVRALVELGDYSAEDIEWFSTLGIYDFEEMEKERYGCVIGR